MSQTEGLGDRVRNRIRINPDGVILVAMMLLAILTSWIVFSAAHNRHDQGYVILRLQAENSEYAAQLIELRRATLTAYEEGFAAGRRAARTPADRQSERSSGSVTIALGEWASGERIRTSDGSPLIRGRGIALWLR